MLLEEALAAIPGERGAELRHDAEVIAATDAEAEQVVDAEDSSSDMRDLRIKELESTVARLEEHNQELMMENSQLENAIFQANEMALKAESASHVKSQFLADMSHEIRTPMNAVLGMASMMEGTQLTAEQRDFIETIRTSGETLIELINDILDFSKIEAGRIDLECIPLKPRSLINETINLLRLKAEDRHLTLTGKVDDAVPEVLTGDPTRIRQILINLVGNAIKFTHEGGVSMNVKVESAEDLKVRLIFSVKDTGIGIPKDRMDRLFRPFSQVDASTTRNYGGTGLGLAISSRLCEMMNGKMWVESTPGVGSTFFFTTELLPPTTQDGVAGDDAGACEEAEHVIDPAKVRLLLAEDNAVNSKVAILLLKRAGYSPDLAENGKEVLEAFHKRDYDIVLMDMQMPVMDGLEATRRLRKTLAHKHLHPYVVALTASAGKPDHDRCIEAGMDAFLAKPIRVNEMLAVLKKAPMSCMGHAHTRNHIAVAAKE
jgi:signal transduction histidine kinase/AmiR/NasT family two-component response regulator